MPDSSQPVVRAQMLIRRPAAEVYRAFVDPAVTTRFWFTGASGPLEPGKEIVWEFAMYGLAFPVRVLELEPDRRILLEWRDPATPVEWRFEPRGEQSTMVTISNWGFAGSDEEILAAALDSQGGFSFLLAGLKAYLEHGVSLGLTGDHHPDAHVDKRG